MTQEHYIILCAGRELLLGILNGKEKDETKMS